MTDAEMIDWLEAQINEHGEIHLHDGEHPRGTGLGLRPGTVVRTLREAIALAAPLLVADPAERSAPSRPYDDALWDQTLKERDNYQEWADKLAAAIAKHLGVEIGEHSNMNNPWAEALDAIEMTPAEILSARLLDAWCASHGKQIPWAKAIEISAVVCKMSDEEKQRLLFLDEPMEAPREPT